MLRVSAKDAAELARATGQKVPKAAKRKKAGTCPTCQGRLGSTNKHKAGWCVEKADFEAAYAYRERTGCWHSIVKVAGRWICEDGTCLP